MTIYFFRAETAPERAAINHFLRWHNQRGQGSITGFVAYYAAAHHDPERPLLERMVAAAKFCPLHTPKRPSFSPARPGGMSMAYNVWPPIVPLKTSLADLWPGV